jgi:hypothetical protein
MRGRVDENNPVIGGVVEKSPDIGNGVVKTMMLLDGFLNCGNVIAGLLISPVDEEKGETENLGREKREEIFDFWITDVIIRFSLENRVEKSLFLGYILIQFENNFYKFQQPFSKHSFGGFYITWVDMGSDDLVEFLLIITFEIVNLYSQVYQAPSR